MSSSNSTASFVRRPLVFILLALAITALIVWVSDSKQASGKSESKPLESAQPPVSIPNTFSSSDGNHSEVAAPRRTYPESLTSQEQPQGTLVYARGVSVVPGTIVCSDQRTVSVMFDLYVASSSDRFRSQLTHGESELVDGKAEPSPTPEDYGCVLIPSGTPMREQHGQFVTIVSIHMPDGTNLKGVTLPSMIGSQEQKDAEDAEQAFQASTEAIWDDFQKQLPTVSKAKPNLRWYTTADRSALVIPYGPCAVILHGSNGYAVREVSIQRSWGPFAEQQAAMSTAEGLCEHYAEEMEADPGARMGPESPLTRKRWFSPQTGIEPSQPAAVLGAPLK
jgi:hypothetical protein